MGQGCDLSERRMELLAQNDNTDFSLEAHYISMELDDDDGMCSIESKRPRLGTGIQRSIEKIEQITSNFIDEFLWNPTGGVIAYSVVQFVCFLIGAFLCLQFWNAYDASVASLSDDDFGIAVGTPSERSWVLTLIWTVSAVLYLVCYSFSIKKLVHDTKYPGTDNTSNNHHNHHNHNHNHNHNAQAFTSLTPFGKCSSCSSEAQALVLSWFHTIGTI